MKWRCPDLVLVLLGGLAMTAADARAAPVVLNCEIKEGAPKGGENIQILIDEIEKILVYNYQLMKNGEIKDGKYIVKHQVNNGNGYTEDQFVDASMKISIANDKFLQAGDIGRAIAITKHDAKFVKAYVTPVQGNDGSWIAFGNVHWGQCYQSPF